jgi:hypothetical protein
MVKHDEISSIRHGKTRKQVETERRSIYIKNRLNEKKMIIFEKLEKSRIAENKFSSRRQKV